MFWLVDLFVCLCASLNFKVHFRKKHQIQSGAEIRAYMLTETCMNYFAIQMEPLFTFYPNYMVAPCQDQKFWIHVKRWVLLIYAGHMINSGNLEHERSSCFETFHCGFSLRAQFYLFCLKCVCLKIAWYMDSMVQFLVELIARLCFVCFWCDIQCLAGKDLSGQQETIHHQMCTKKTSMDKTDSKKVGNKLQNNLDNLLFGDMLTCQRVWTVCGVKSMKRLLKWSQ